jgi:hypothetical protein
MFVGFISYILGGSLETTGTLLVVLGPIFFGLATLALVLLVKEVTDNLVGGLIAGTLFSLFPGSLLTQTTATSGTRLGFELAMILWFIYALKHFYRVIEENYVVISDLDFETLYRSPESYVLVVTPVIGILGVLTSVFVGLTVLSVLFISLVVLTAVWDDDQEGYSEILLGSVALTTLVVIAVGGLILLGGGLSSIGDYSLLLTLLLFSLVLSVIGLLSNLYGPDRKIAAAEAVVSVAYLGGISVLFFGREIVTGYFTSSLPFISSYLLEFAPLWAQGSPVEDFYVSQLGLVAYLAYFGFGVFLYYWYQKETQWISTEDIIVISTGLVALLFHIGSTDFFPLFAIFGSIFSVYLFTVIADTFDISYSTVSKEDLLSRKVIVVGFILLLVAPTLLVPVTSGETTVVGQSEEIQRLTGTSNDVVEFISQNTSEGDTVLTWRSQSLILGSLTPAETTGNSQVSAQRTANILASSSENATQGNEYIVLSGSQITGTGDYGAIAEFSEPDRQEHIQIVYDQASGQFGFMSHKQPYYDSLTTRMYLYHGQAFSGGTVTQTYMTQNEQYVSRPAEDIAKQDHIINHESQEEFRSYLEEESEPQITKKRGGIGVYPPEQVSALENHRYVYSDTQSVLRNPRFSQHVSQYQDYSDDLETRDFVIDTAETKVFQRVPGTQITVENMPANTTGQVFITLENSQTGTPFRYISTVSSGEDGVGQVTVPYATQNNPEDYSVTPSQHDEYEIIVRTQSLTSDPESGEVTPQLELRHASVPVTNEDVTTGAQKTVTLQDVSQSEYQQILQRQQPEQQSSENDQSDDGSNDDS